MHDGDARGPREAGRFCSPPQAGWVGLGGWSAVWWWTLEIDLSLVVGAGGRGGERTTGASAQRCVAFAGLPAAGCGCRLPDRCWARWVWRGHRRTHRIDDHAVPRHTTPPVMHTSVLRH
jgi:hypothetical protein